MVFTLFLLAFATISFLPSLDTLIVLGRIKPTLWDATTSPREDSCTMALLAHTKTDPRSPPPHTPCGSLIRSWWTVVVHPLSPRLFRCTLCAELSAMTTVFLCCTNVHQLSPKLNDLFGKLPCWTLPSWPWTVTVRTGRLWRTVPTKNVSLSIGQMEEQKKLVVMVVIGVMLLSLATVNKEICLLKLS